MSKKKKSSSRVKKVKKGQTVSVHYIGRLEDGTEFDSSRARNEALSFEVGAGQMIPGFDLALPGMKIGETKNVTLSPEEAYGEVHSEAYQTVPNTAFPPDYKPAEGETVRGQNPAGQPIIARVESVKQDAVVLDFNHPLAGKTLNFEIELLSVN